MKGLPIVLSFIALIGVGAVGFILNSSLKQYSTTQDQLAKAEVIDKLSEKLTDIEAKLEDIKSSSTQKNFDKDIQRIDENIIALKKKIDELEKMKLAAADTSPDSSEDNGDELKKTVKANMELFNKDTENMTEDEKKQVEEERSKAFRSFFRQGAKEFMKMGEHRQQARIDKAVEKLQLSVGQEEALRNVVDNSMKKLRVLVDKQFNNEDVAPEEWEALFKDADAEIKDILTPEQYEEWKKDDPMRRGGPGPGMYGGRRGRNRDSNNSGENR